MRQWLSAGDAKEWRRVVENRAVPTVVVFYDYVFNTDALKEVLRDIYGELAADDHLLFLLVCMEDVARAALGFNDVVDPEADVNEWLERDAGVQAKNDDATAARRKSRREAERVTYAPEWVQVGHTSCYGHPRNPAATYGIPQLYVAASGGLDSRYGTKAILGGGVAGGYHRRKLRQRRRERRRRRDGGDRVCADAKESRTMPTLPADVGAEAWAQVCRGPEGVVR